MRSAFNVFGSSPRISGLTKRDVFLLNLTKINGKLG